MIKRLFKKEKVKLLVCFQGLLFTQMFLSGLGSYSTNCSFVVTGLHIGLPDSQALACQRFPKQFWEFDLVWHEIKVFFMACEIGKMFVLFVNNLGMLIENAVLFPLNFVCVGARPV